MAALFMLVALTGCAFVAAGPGQVPNAPYQKAIFATPAECTSGIAGRRAPISKPGPAVRLVLGPPRMSPADQGQFSPASKPATGTALDISLPSIRNTRPLDADSRTFNAS